MQQSITSLLIADGAGSTEGVYSLFMVMFCFVVVMVVLTTIYVVRRAFDKQSGEIGGWEFRGAFGRIRAVARNTLAEGIRTKVASGFALLILLAIPIFWLTATGDGTIKGQVQMFIAYSLGFAGFMLALLTIFFSCRSLSVEVSSRQIYSVVSKPIPRWQIVVGKMAGVLFLDAVLLMVAAIATYAGTIATLHRFETKAYNELQTYGHLTPTEAGNAIAALQKVKGVGGKGMDSPIIPAMAEALGRTDDGIAEVLLALPEETRVNLRKYDELRRQVLICRANVMPEPPNFAEAVEKHYREMEKAHNLPEGMREPDIRKKIEEDLELRSRTVAAGQARRWVMKGPPPAAGDEFLLSVRFKVRASRYLMAEPPAPAIGRPALDPETLWAGWGFGDPRSTKFMDIALAHPVNQFNEFEIPREAVERDGTVLVNFANIDPRGVDAVFEAPYGLQILYRVGSFPLSLVHAALALYIPLVCLAAFGVCASTFLSFPVASLIVLTLYILSSSMGFVAESLGTTKDYYDPDHITLALEIRQITVDVIGWALAIGDTDPITHVINGQSVGWNALWTAIWKFVLVKSTIVTLLGVFIFRRRELAAVIV